MSMKDRVDRAYKKSGAGSQKATPEEKPEAKPEVKPAAQYPAGGPSRRRPIEPPSVDEPESFMKRRAGRSAGTSQGGRPAGSRAGKPSLALGEAVAAAERSAEALLKTGAEPGVARAAKFLLLLGTEEASKVLAHLGPAEIEAVSREILKVKDMDAIEANEILAEFGWLVRTKGWSVAGGPETAEKMLTAAFGPDRARSLLMKAAPDSLRPFRFLNDFEAKDLHLILKEESPQVLAVILPYIEPKRASGLIERLPEEMRVEVVKRVAKLEKVSPETLRRVEEGLKERIRKIGSVSTEEVDGTAALAGILRHVDPRLEERVLEALADENPELSRNVRERLFTMDDVLRVPDRELQKALRDFQDRDIALVLKGRADDFKEKILRNVSANRRSMIADEYSILGAVRREDADAAAREFLAYLKRAWEDGELALEGDDDLVV
ncbi:MAG TPA: FliG C-terminal domain-containing protein [Rectinemataceae bacterium]|nr:FliG C-terminal domain-containing protein [Rectinemataceae bacterium]